MAMRPILGPDGKPLHAVPRQLITPGVVNAIADWAENVRTNMLGEHEANGVHAQFQFPKAAIWLMDMTQDDCFHHASVIGTAPASASCKYTVRNVVSTVIVGVLEFSEGLPGEVVILNSDFHTHNSAEPPNDPFRRVRILSQTEVELTVPRRATSVGVLVY